MIDGYDEDLKAFIRVLGFFMLNYRSKIKTSW